MSTKVQLQLKKPYYEDYLRWLFQSPEGDIVVSGSKNLGRIIYTLLSRSEIPVKPKQPIAVPLLIPYRHNKLPEGFYFFNEAATEQINEMVDVFLDLDFRSYCLAGTEMGMQRKDVYASFLHSRNFTPSCDLFEMLKKRDYRLRKKFKNLLEEHFDKAIVV